MLDALRFGALYAAIYLSLGATLPFLPVFLAERGLSASEIALVLALGQLARFLGGPLVAARADQMGDRRRVLALCGLVAALGALLHVGSSGWVALSAASVLYGVAVGPLSPIADSLALHAARSGAFQFGRVRAVGSFAFLVGTFGGGLGLEAVGAKAVPILAAAAIALVVPASLLLAPVQPGPAARGFAGAAELLRSTGFRRLLLGSGLVQGSHAGYYAFSALYWRSEGLSEGWIASLWSIGVGTEILLLVFARGVIVRLGPARLTLLAGCAAVFRWSLTGFVLDPFGLAALQALHAASFGALMLGAVLWIGERIAAERGATAQALHAGLGQGTGSFLLTLAAGPLFARWGGGMFLAMAGAAALGSMVLLGLDRGRPGAG